MRRTRSSSQPRIPGRSLPARLPDQSHSRKDQVRFAAKSQPGYGWYALPLGLRVEGLAAQCLCRWTQRAVMSQRPHMLRSWLVPRHQGVAQSRGPRFLGASRGIMLNKERLCVPLVSSTTMGLCHRGPQGRAAASAGGRWNIVRTRGTCCHHHLRQVYPRPARSASTWALALR
jgi:hypothetical protein